MHLLKLLPSQKPRMGSLGLRNESESRLQLSRTYNTESKTVRVLGCKVNLDVTWKSLTDGRILESLQRYTSAPTYLPVNFQLLNTDSSFFLKEATQEFMRNSSLLSRTEPFFIHQARKPPSLIASYGTLSLEQAVPLDLLQTPGTFVTSSDLFTFNWNVQTFILTEKIYLDKPKVQVLFYVSGRDWDDYTTVDKLPCVRMFAFHETQEVRGSCRLRSELGICVAELEPLPGWYAPPSVVPGRQRGTDLSSGTSVELYYSLHVVESGECLGEDLGVRHSARMEQEGLFGSATSTPRKRIGSVRLFRMLAVPDLSEQRLDGNFAVLVPSAPVRPRDSVSAYVAASPYSPVEMFTLSSFFRAAEPSVHSQWVLGGLTPNMATEQAVITTTPGSVELAFSETSQQKLLETGKPTAPLASPPNLLSNYRVVLCGKPFETPGFIRVVERFLWLTSNINSRRPLPRVNTALLLLD
ncbi:transmembrane protein 132C-like [Hoplias malabaricus]|uniref:transmembrane protein 132C-like n=1 Tax=Hoplias malabaricus TaxID=27720 RepID=UPI0034637D9A